MPVGVVVFPSDISGNVASFTDEGKTIIEASGQTIGISFGGNTVQVTTAGSLVTQEQQPTQFIPGPLVTVTSASGGVRLGANAVSRAVIRSHPQNSGYLFLGSQTFPPYSGFGFVLAPGEAYSQNVNNFNVFRVYAQLSGDRITYGGSAL
jgi:hypothetical protein